MSKSNSKKDLGSEERTSLSSSPPKYQPNNYGNLQGLNPTGNVNTNMNMNVNVNVNGNGNSPNYAVDQDRKPGGGVIAKPKYLKDSSFVEALTSNVTSTMTGWLSYLPTSVSKNLPVVTEKSSKPKILWATFQRNKIRKMEDSGNMDPQGSLYLTLGYVDGFQVWDCTNIEEIREVLSVKDGPTRCAKLLDFPSEERMEASNEKQDAYERFESNRPHLAIIASESAQKIQWSTVKIYSLKTNEAVHVIRFKSEVFNIYSNSRIVVVCLHDQLFAFDSRTYKNAFSISSCQPNPHSGSSVVALGSRWIAYATSQPVAKNQKKMYKAEEESAFTSQAVVGAAKEVAVDLAQNLYSWGDKGFQAVSNYFSGTTEEKTNPNSRSPPKRLSENGKYPSAGNGSNPSLTGGAAGGSNGVNNSAGSENAVDGVHGTVMIRDVVTRSSVAQFQAHSANIAAMAFNPNGSLLVTASTTGYDFNVFQIFPNITGDPSKPTFKHLYKLRRGVFTNAIIEDISFSNNSQWVNVTSARGTTHIFPINPFGGCPSVYSHTNEKNDGGPFPLNQPVSNELENLNALEKIRQTSPLFPGGDENAASSASYNTANPSPQTLIYQKARKVAIASCFVSRVDSLTPVGAPNGTLGNGSGPSDDNSENPTALGVLAINPLGVLSFYLLCPKAQKTQNKNGLEAKELKLQVEQLIEWNLIRGDNWVPVTNIFEKATTNRRRVSNSKWLSNVEIATHVTQERPIWMGPQFIFKTFQANSSANGHDRHEQDSEAIITSTNIDEDENGFEDDLPSRSLDIKRTAPVPYRGDPYENDLEAPFESASPNDFADNLFDALEERMPFSHLERKDDDFQEDNSLQDWEDLNQNFAGSNLNSKGKQQDNDFDGEYENLDHENIDAPDGDNELELPTNSVMLN